MTWEEGGAYEEMTPWKEVVALDATMPWLNTACPEWNVLLPSRTIVLYLGMGWLSVELGEEG